jgi:hypothetical protein
MTGTGRFIVDLLMIADAKQPSEVVCVHCTERREASDLN